ncbi:MAG: magnesium/cobalt transporter CorA [Candidatus Latescibacterota bacterium]
MPHLPTRSKPPGLAPGSLVYAGEPPGEPARIHLFSYDPQTLEERRLEEIEDCRPYLERGTSLWIDVEGVHDVELVRRLGSLFDIHLLTLEDVVHTRQRPKLEEYAGYLYVVLQMMHYEHEECTLEAEQISLLVGERFVISLQEGTLGDVFEPVRVRLRQGQGRIRGAGSDYLAHALIDLTVDHYVVVLEGLGEHVDEVEDAVTTDPRPEHLARINRLRRHVALVRRSVWPLQDSLLRASRSDVPLLSPGMQVFFRDVYDHAVRAADMVDALSEAVASLVGIYASMVNYRLTEVMKVLTIIATFFLPLTFVAGIYGMNFNPVTSPLNMPELDWYFGYPFALALMAGIGAGMFLYFRRRHWL